ncbi:MULTISPECIES: hypothetical protein [Nocardia]|uniref:hypothetical protein n=1 Tax=Nocardia TaxID=1817 RepID=UPI000D69E8A4|nr:MULTISPECIES: hypothetical protein [Nocardia]
MRANTFAATALLAIGATGITAGAAAAQPVSDTEAAIHGVEHGIGYVAAATADRTGVTATVDAGRFTLAPDAASVALTDNAGNIVASIPLAAAQSTARISAEGRTLTFTPQSASAQAIDEAADTLARKQYNAGIGALVGAGIGAVLGFFLGGVGALVTVPIGAGIGALVGYSTP